MITQTCPDITQRLRELASQAAAIAKEMPFSHSISNDVQALVFMIRLRESGYEVRLGDAEACLQRLQITQRTGEYPTNLLS